MIWLFALGIIALAVFHSGFRRVVFWSGGAAIALTLIAVIIVQSPPGHQQSQELVTQTQERKPLGPEYFQCQGDPALTAKLQKMAKEDFLGAYFSAGDCQIPATNQ